MDLVDEENVAVLERGQDRRQVAFALERRTRDRTDSDAQLLTDDVGETRLSQPRGTDEKNVVERLAAAFRSFERDSQLLLDALLADELVQAARAERTLQLVLLGSEHDGGRDSLGHAARRAWRTRSAGDR